MERDGELIFDAPHENGRVLELADSVPEELTDAPLSSFFTAKVKSHGGGKRGSRRKRR